MTALWTALFGESSTGGTKFHSPPSVDDLHIADLESHLLPDRQGWSSQDDRERWSADGIISCLTARPVEREVDLARVMHSVELTVIVNEVRCTRSSREPPQKKLSRSDTPQPVTCDLQRGGSQSKSESVLRCKSPHGDSPTLLPPETSPNIPEPLPRARIVPVRRNVEMVVSVDEEDDDVDDSLLLPERSSTGTVPATEVGKMQLERSAVSRGRLPKKLFRARQASRSLQERMHSAMRRHSETEAARLAALRRAVEEDVQSATRPLEKRAELFREVSSAAREAAIRSEREAEKRSTLTGISGRFLSWKAKVEAAAALRRHQPSRSSKFAMCQAKPITASRRFNSKRSEVHAKISDKVASLAVAACASAGSSTKDWRPITPTGRVASMVRSYEELTRRALREAARKEDALRDVHDLSDARSQRRLRRGEQLRARQAEQARGAVAAPTFSNVSTSPLQVAVEISTATPGAIVAYSINGGSTWRDYERPVVLEDNSLNYKRVVVLAYGRKQGLSNSDVATAVFAVEQPRFMRHASCRSELELAKYALRGAVSGLACSLCNAPCDDCAYVAFDQSAKAVSLALCAKCALAPLASLDPSLIHRVTTQEPLSIRDNLVLDTADNKSEGRRVKRHGHATSKYSTAVTDYGCKQDGPPAVTVAVDSGGHRFWLSENILFEGNTATVLPRSFHLLKALADIMLKHPTICIRIEGHTNSKCGTTCNGDHLCSNDTCRSNFGACGGALAFSKRRADSVKAWLSSDGQIEPDRIHTRGYAGSRRVIDDTESELNYLNRRVEIHMTDFA